MALTNLSIYYTWKNIKSEYYNNRFKTFTLTWNNTFDLPDGYYSISDIQDYFEFFIKKHETLTQNSSIQICPNKIKNRILLKIKTGCKVELLTLVTKKLQKKLLIKIKTAQAHLNQNLLKLFQCIVIQSKMISSKVQNFCLFLFQISNLDS